MGGEGVIYCHTGDGRRGTVVWRGEVERSSRIRTEFNFSPITRARVSDAALFFFFFPLTSFTPHSLINQLSLSLPPAYVCVCPYVIAAQQQQESVSLSIVSFRLFLPSPSMQDG